MIRRIVDEGRPLKTVAAEFGLSERRTGEWLRRYRALGAAGLENRSSRPRTVANKTMAHQISAIRRLRREYRLTGAEIGEKLELARSTVAGWLVRLGLGRLSCLDPKPPVHHRLPDPGAALVQGAGRQGRAGNDRQRRWLHCKAATHGHQRQNATPGPKRNNLIRNYI